MHIETALQFFTGPDHTAGGDLLIPHQYMNDNFSSKKKKNLKAFKEIC